MAWSARGSRCGGRWKSVPCAIAGVLLALSCTLAGAQATVGEADARTAAGVELFRLGRFAEAVRYWEGVEREQARAANPRARAEALVRLAQALHELGQVERARAALRAALALPEIGEPLAASALSLLGVVQQLAGESEEARKAIESALALAISLRRPDVQAVALHDLGNLHLRSGRQEDALRRYEESVALAGKAGERGQQARSALNAARAALALDRPEAASRHAENARAALDALPPAHEKAFGLVSLGEFYQQALAKRAGAGLLEASHAALTQALQVAEAIGDERTASYALGFLGHLYEIEKRPLEAAVPTRRAIFLAQQASAPDLLYRWHWQNGRLYRLRGENENAIGEYRRAIEQLETIRHDLAAGSGGGISTFRTIFAPLYFELADLLLQRSARSTRPAETEALLREARDIVELSKSAELQDYFQDRCVAEQQARVAQVGEIGERTAVIYPILLRDRLELLLTFAGGMKQVTLPVRAEDLVEDIRSFRLLLEKRTTRQYLPLAQKLYATLVKPLESELAARRVETLVVVPDGALRTIPMAALHDGQDFLVARYALATTPGLTLTDPQPLASRKLDVLLNGLSLPVQGFSSLPNVPAEIDTVQKLVGGRVLRDREYLVGSVERELGERAYSVVHIASHGQFRSDPRETFLLAYDGRLSMDKLEQLIAPSRYRARPVELLTLSACQTAAGDDRAALGLAGVAVKAGARSALATLWFVNDQSSTLLVSAFYRNLPGSSKASALQQAQLELIADSRYRHPGYWAPFLLIGNWL